MRPFSVIVGLLLIVGGMISLLVYLTFGISTRAPESIDVSGLSNESVLQFAESGAVQIESASVDDAIFSLGFTHAVNHPWEILLMRQAALGRLAEWFSTDALSEDIFTRRLRLAVHAKTDFDNLDSLADARLRVYAKGINAGINLDATRASAPLILMEIDPEPWLPWHSIAVERLWAWLGTPSSSLRGIDSTAVAAWLNSEEAAADEALRSRLHVFGFEQNVLLSLGPNPDQREVASELQFRFVTGNTGVPVFQPISIQISGSPRVEGISLPGTLLLPAGRNSSGAWAYLNQVPFALQSATVNDTVHVAFDRVRDNKGHEELLEIRSSRDGLLVLTPAAAEGAAAGAAADGPAPAGATADGSAAAAAAAEPALDQKSIALLWPGNTTNSVTPQWIDSFSGEIPGPTPFSGDGLQLTPDGELNILMAPVLRPGSGTPSGSGPGAGTPRPPQRPAEIFKSGRVSILTNSPGRDDLLNVIREINSQPGGISDPDLLHDARSSAFREFADSIVAATAGLQILNVRTEEALDYIRAWDQQFDGSSIAASLIATMDQYYRMHPYDSLTTQIVRDGLQAALDTLSGSFGTDLRAWRWESVQNRWVYFPGDGHRSPNSPRHTRQFVKDFAPVRVAGRGHPTSLSWGPKSGNAGPSASAVWNGRFSSSMNGVFLYSHEAVSYTRFLGRFLAENRAVRIMSLYPQPVDSSEFAGDVWTTTLRPIKN